MTDIDPVHRLDAKEAKDKLGTIVNSMTPESLLIKPKTLRDKHGLPNIPLKQVRWEILTAKVGQSGCVTTSSLAGICEEQWLMDIGVVINIGISSPGPSTATILSSLNGFLSTEQTT